MKTRWLQNALVVVLLLGAANAQNPSNTSSPAPQAATAKATPVAQNSTAIGDAVKNDEFHLTKGEYKLRHLVKVDAAPKKEDNLKVDYQIGTIDNKPATVSVVVDKDKAPKSPTEADTMFGTLSNESAHVSGSGQVEVQKCGGDKTCVKTDDKGRCIKWLCS